METIIIAVISITALGFICSLLLSIASKAMAVEVDERLALVRNALPGANCGACGYSGCNGYAAALVEGNVAANLCPPGGDAVVAMISEIMGLSGGDAVEKKIAVAHCAGDCDYRLEKMDYSGIRTCHAAQLLFGGQNACSFGCLGYGDCLEACPSDAICLKDGLACVAPNRCTGCGLCVGACPSKVISTYTAPVSVAVLCRNIERGAVLKDKCSKGCIGCMKCAKICPTQAITVTDFLASIDYSKCVGCKECVSTCPKGCIFDY